MDTQDHTHRQASNPRWTEHLARAAEAFAHEIREVVPGDFSKHARGSLREGLLAIRSLIDNGIEQLETREQDQTARKIEVE